MIRNDTLYASGDTGVAVFDIDTAGALHTVPGSPFLSASTGGSTVTYTAERMSASDGGVVAGGSGTTAA